MASKTAGSENPTGTKDQGATKALKGRLKDSWLSKNWQTALILVLIIALAFFVRAYFAYPVSVDNGYLVSGGSDSYYHMRVIDHVVETGQHLVIDPLLNYPDGIRNMRPPLYDWSVAVSGMALDSMGMSIDDGVGLSLVLSTAFWGSLTIIPVYLLANAAFGRKVGLLASFLFALMPGHIERSVLSNADHDAMVLFFVVFALYFFMKSLQSIEGTKWVESWKKPSSILNGFKGYVKQNQISMIYAALGGMCVSAVAMIWTGYTYLLIIILVYYVVQLIVDRFRGADSMGVVMSMATMWVVGFLAMMPVYYFMNYWATWFDMPVILFIIGVVAGLIFMVTRDYPWVLILPIITALTVIGLLALYLVAPSIFEAVISGQGYLVKSKLYSTISEAQAPVFSTLVMSFGALTFWLALIGVGYAAIKIPKTSNPYFVFIVVYGAVSIYMAASAGRFLFNSAPAFAILGGWILALIIGFVKYDEFFRSLASTFKSPKAFLRKLGNIKVIAISLILVFLLIVPNVWTAMDASIPTNDKKDYDRQIYDALPAFVHPSSYDTTNGTYWYLGAFSYSLSTSDEYWPAAWSWFKQQDSASADVEKPAFLSWWDYGFEAVQEGDHPTVADNFQDAYQYAGTFICSQNESQAIALFIIRAVESVDRTSTDWTQLMEVMDAAGVNATKFQDVMDNPVDYTDYVLGHSEIFGAYDTSISVSNVKYAMASYVLLRAGEENVVEIYNQAREITGNDIGYFAIDARLFPFSATSSNIFYAPVKLSDRRIDPTTNDPTDFYEIVAIDQYGTEYNLADVTSDMTIVDYSIDYKDMFYNSMLYRAYMGFSPTDIGKTQDGIPGISGSLYSYSAQPAWNLTHFRMVYRTAYYNPWPEDQVQNHTKEWVATSYDHALELQDQIDNGTLNWTVDVSSASLMSGVVFIQYYDGVIIHGNALSEDGQPMAGIWVTVLDEYGIPHNTVKTDENGYYEVIAPFGDVSVVYSYGLLDLRTQLATEITRTNYTFTYAQAMRQTATGSMTGSNSYSTESDPDWIINGTIVLKSGDLTGKVYLNKDSSTSYSSANDELLMNATVVLVHKATGFTRSTVAVNGTYSFTGLPPMSGATIYAVYKNHTFGTKTTSVSPNSTTTTDLYVKASSITATITLPWGTPAGDISVDLTDRSSGIVITSVTNSNGKVTFSSLLPGNYTIQAHDAAYTLGPKDIEVSAGSTLAQDLVLYDAMYVSGQVLDDAYGVPYAKVGFISATGEKWITANATGYYSAVVPRVNQTIYSLAILNGQEKVFLDDIVATNTVVVNPTLSTASLLHGTVMNGNKTVSGARIVVTSGSASLSGISNANGTYRFALPSGSYMVYVGKSNMSYWNTLSTGNNTIALAESPVLSGYIWYDADHDGAKDSTEVESNITVTVSSGSKVLNSLTSTTGTYSIPVPLGGDYTLTVAVDNYVPVVISINDLTGNETNNIELVPADRSVSGTVTLPGDVPLANVNIYFTAVGGGASNETATSNNGTGAYAVSLSPGQYKVTIDQNVNGLDSSSIYQTLKTNYVNITIGQSASVVDLDAVVRYKVNGTISPGSGTLALTADDLDTVDLEVSGQYSTYLQAGTYNAYCLLTSSGDRYANLTKIIVSGPTVTNFTAAKATRAEITLRYSSETLGIKVPVTIHSNATGGDLVVNSTTLGKVNVYLPNGDYEITVDYHTKGVVGAFSQIHYLVYTGMDQMTVDLMGTNSITLSLDRDYDNSTVTGLVNGVEYRFTKASTSAIDTNFTYAGGSIALAPGNYTVYAIDAANHVYFGTVIIEPYTTNNLDLTMSLGYKVNGTILRNGAAAWGHAWGNITVTQGSASMDFEGNSDGSYEVYLPAGAFLITATTETVEQTIEVKYKGSVSVDLTAPRTINIDTAKVVKYTASLTWDGVKKTVANGEAATYMITLTNTGNMVDTYTMGYSASDWNVTFSKTVIENLTYGTGNSVQISVTLIPSSSVFVTHTAPILKVTSSNGAKAQLTVDATIVADYKVNVTYTSASTQTPTSGYIYKLSVKNAGNAADTYLVTVDNTAELQAQGWNATLRQGDSGNFTTYINISLSASRTSTIYVKLTPTNDTPEALVGVVVNAVSAKDPGVNGWVYFLPAFSDLYVADDGMVVDGSDISLSTPEVPLETYIVLGLVFALGALTIYFSIQRGVFSRKK